MTTPAASAERIKLNRELAQMLKGGVIMDVTTPEQARRMPVPAPSWRSSASRQTSAPPAVSLA